MSAWSAWSFTRTVSQDRGSEWSVVFVRCPLCRGPKRATRQPGPRKREGMERIPRPASFSPAQWRIAGSVPCSCSPGHCPHLFFSVCGVDGKGRGFFEPQKNEGQQDCGSGGRGWRTGSGDSGTQAPTRPTPSRSIASSRSTILYPNRTTFFRFHTLPLTLLPPRSSLSICEFPRPHRVSDHPQPPPPKPAQWHPPSSICAARPSR